MNHEYLVLTDNQTRRFLKKIRNGLPNACWPWAGCKEKDGYGICRINLKRLRAHRVSYELFRGKIPKGLVIDHLCRQRACVNPLHMEPVTSAENTGRSEIAPAVINSKKKYCLRGHPLSGDNLILTKDNKRNCRICRRIHWKTFYYTRKKLHES